MVQNDDWPLKNDHLRLVGGDRLQLAIWFDPRYLWNWLEAYLLDLLGLQE